MLDYLHKADFWKFQLPVLHADVAALIIRGISLTALVFALEIRETDGLVTEEIPVGRVQL